MSDEEIHARALNLWWGNTEGLIDTLVDLLADMRREAAHTMPAAMLENVLTEGFR